MKNLLALAGFIILAVALYLVWGNLDSKIVALESATGSYIYTEAGETDAEPDPPDPIIPEPPPAASTNVDLEPLRAQLAELEAAQRSNAEALESLLQRINALLAQSCSAGNCGNRIVARERIYFEHDQNTLSAGEAARIDRLLDGLGENAWISLRGHADTSGDNFYNHLLSLRRAAAVKRHIDERLRGDSRRDQWLISIEGTGEESLVKFTSDEVRERSNRLVEILVFEINLP